MGTKKYIWIVFSIVFTTFIVITLLGYFGYQSLYRSQPSSKHKTIDTTANTDILIASYLNNEVDANTLYLNKTIAVSGTIKEVNTLNNRNTIVLESTHKNHYVLCDLEIGQLEQTQVKLGQTIQIKGVCKGFLMDVVLHDCVIIP